MTMLLILLLCFVLLSAGFGFRDGPITLRSPLSLILLIVVVLLLLGLFAPHYGLYRY